MKEDMTYSDTNNAHNAHIEVYGASIIKDNEHHRFNIGDVINNGYCDFTIKGFTRPSLGLAYALDNGSKIIGWLVEQVDNKCHLVSRAQTQFSAQDRGTIDEIILALRTFGEEKKISYDKEIEFLQKIREL